MSHRATNWAFSQRDLKPGPKLTLLCLADRHNNDFGCFPSQETLAEDACVSRSTLNDHLDLLERKGLIRRERRVNPRTRRQESTRYILGFEDDFAQDAGGPRPKSGHGTEEEQAPQPVSEKQTRPVSGNKTRSVSGFPAEPCPDFPQSRVRNSDTNPVKEPGKEPTPRAPARQAPAPAREAPGGGEYSFDDFMAAYPNPVERDAARRAWDRLIAEGASPARLIVKARRYAGSDKVKRGYAKTPANWLRDGGWRDPQPGEAPAATTPSGDVAAFWADRIAEGKAYGAATSITPRMAAEMIQRQLVEADTLRGLGVAL